MKFRPCIDLHDGKVKQIVGETLTDNQTIENFISKNGAEFFAKIYKEAKLTGGHIVMLGPGNRDEAIKALHAFPGGMQIGGGLNDENYKEYLDEGASHIIVTSFIFSDKEIDLEKVKRISNSAGSKKLVIDLSCKLKNNNYYVVSNKWKDFTNFKITKDSLGMLSKYCDEFLIHAADVEGKKNGADLRLIELLSEITDIPVTYAGGIQNLDDVKEVSKSGNNKIDLTIGSALDLFGGNIKIQELLKLPEFN